MLDGGEVPQDIAVRFVLMFVCVTGIANGPVGPAVFYEQEVHERLLLQIIIGKGETR